jgi:hypothetical protein
MRSRLCRKRSLARMIFQYTWSKLGQQTLPNSTRLLDNSSCPHRGSDQGRSPAVVPDATVWPPSLEKVFDLVPAMDRRAVPDHHQFARNLAQKHTQETHDGCGIIGSRTHLQKQSPIEGDATDERSDDRASTAPAGRASDPVVPRCVPPSARDKSRLHRALSMMTLSCSAFF